MSSPAWSDVGTIPRERLREARDQVHWALQALPSASRAFMEHSTDACHESVTVSPEGRFVSANLGWGRRLALEAKTLTLFDTDEGSQELARFPLVGRSLAEAVEWIKERFAEFDLRGGAPPAIPDYDLPEHPVAGGAAFEAPDEAAIAELLAWYAHASRELQAAFVHEAGAGALRLWPHHFDLAGMLSLPAQNEATEARSIGLGFTPGDAVEPAPCFYALPWPPPKDCSLLEKLDAGSWNHEGWTGAILRYAEITAAGSPGEQVRCFLSSALAASRQALGH